MTNYGYDYILKEIQNRIIEPPTDLGLKELTGWLNGYSTCQNDIIKLIQEIKESNIPLK